MHSPLALSFTVYWLECHNVDWTSSISSTTNTIQALSAGLQGSTWSCTTTDFCQPVSAVVGRSELQSSMRNDLFIVSTTTNFGWRSFAVSAPLASNQLTFSHWSRSNPDSRLICYTPIWTPNPIFTGWRELTHRVFQCFWERCRFTAVFTHFLTTKQPDFNITIIDCCIVTKPWNHLDVFMASAMSVNTTLLIKPYSIRVTPMTALKLALKVTLLVECWCCIYQQKNIYSDYAPKNSRS